METIIIGIMVFMVVALLLFAVVMATDLNKLINAEAEASFTGCESIKGGEWTRFKTKGEK